MKVEQIYTGCLAEAAYYIESNGEVAIIDPLRETKPYLDKAKKANAKIKYVFESHFHADFVSGHVDLAKSSGATIVFGPNAVTDYDAHIAKDGEEFKVGNAIIKVIHTPGHTLESSTFLLIDEEGKETAIFTGDTLFLGDVGRPDLAIKSDLTKEDLAGMLFDSLRNKIMTLPDDLIVYPAHGAGSACGKNMSKETVGVLGEQKKTNYALRADMTKAEFIEEVLDGMSPAPQYFAKNAFMNKNGYDNIDEVLSKGNTAFSVEEFEKAVEASGALVLDVRNQADFVLGHIPNAIFIGIEGGFAPWVGALITDIKQPIVLITPEGMEEETVTRLARVGYDNTLGYLKGGMKAWIDAGKELASIESISADEFEKRVKLDLDGSTILDVRKSGEWTSERLANSTNLPLDFINENMYQVNDKDHYYIHCAGGYRSVIFTSILKSRGIHNITDVKGGYNAIKDTGLERTEFVCPSTL
jgi:glyoxylase-like metal-dependent hydrolase (beta-lactamase superfamily II)/rhodanese-related sulfurtransferase